MRALGTIQHALRVFATLACTPQGMGVGVDGGHYTARRQNSTVNIEIPKREQNGNVASVSMKITNNTEMFSCKIQLWGFVTDLIFTVK